jgi:saccharopine dehydrogenase-like NADP-dependent oxidoreductase
MGLYQATNSRHVLVVGAGRVGTAVAYMLGHEPRYSVRIADIDVATAEKVAKCLPLVSEAHPVPLDSVKEARRAMDGVVAVINAAPSDAANMIAQAAFDEGIHYFDLNESAQPNEFIRSLAESPQCRAMMGTGCGLAPGFVTIAAMHLLSRFDTARRLTLRVGALPSQPNNRLKYNLSWSSNRLVRKYTEPCKVLRDGQVTQMPSLSNYERLIVGGVEYEAFSTSGGYGDLPEVLQGMVPTLDFKTIRYPGHLELIRFLLEDLRFHHRPDDLEQIFHRAVPATLDDVVIISVRGLGYTKDEGRYLEETWWRKIHGKNIGTRYFSGIEVGSAAGVCGIMDRVVKGRLPSSGLLSLHEVPYSTFMESVFGKYFD